jgi:hypothetical protein
MATAPTLDKSEDRSEVTAENAVKLGRKKSVASSFVLLALLFFVVLDFTARLTFKSWPIDHFNSPNRSWTWWTMQDFRSQKEKPEIVLMGSSLMLMAVHAGDATLSGVPQNNALHHKSVLLEQTLQTILHKHYNTFSFAIAGQMVSDAYSICSCVYNGKAKPDYIIYGIAPRDFMDNTLPNPASTETFKYLSRVSDLSEIAMRARPSIWDRFDYWVGSVSFLYAHRADILYLQHHYVRVLFSHLHWIEDLNSVHTPMELRKIAMFELPEDNAANEVFTGPYSPTMKYIDNASEYKKRYRSFNKKLFEDQRSYLADMMKICEQRHIKLILVNMPVTASNVQLMPPGFYEHYLRTVQEMAAAHQDKLIDLNNPTLFTDDCFMDSVHLNGKGGMRFFKNLGVRLAVTDALK